MSLSTRLAELERRVKAMEKGYRMQPGRPINGGRRKVEQAKEWLVKYLKAHTREVTYGHDLAKIPVRAQLVSIIFAKGREEGFNEFTLRQARQELKEMIAVNHLQGSRSWIWRLQ